MEVRETGSPPPDVLVSGHYREGQGYGVYRGKGSGNWLLTYTLAGQGMYRQPEASVSAEAGDLVLLDPGSLHDYSTSDNAPWEFLWVHFHPRLEWLDWWRLPAVGQGLYRWRIRTLRNRERISSALHKLRADAWASGSLGWVSGSLGRELALNSLEEVFLLAACECELTEESRIDRRVYEVIAVITSDLAARHDVPMLARQVSLSPSRLSHLFKEHVGNSVMNTLLMLRLREAASLLEHTVWSVGAISEEVGFESPYYFSRQFRRRFGVSPREYRRRAVTAARPRADDTAPVPGTRSTAR